MRKEKFISIIFKTNLKDSDVIMLMDFLKGLIGNYINPTFTDGVLTVLFNAEIEIDFKEIIQTLNEDFYMTSVLFESGVLYSGVDKNLYMEFIISNKSKILETNKLYLSESDLIKNKIYNEILSLNILKEYYHDFEMKKIVKMFLENNMNISKASAVLYMHRNTLMYKIENFINVTGYDIKKFQDAFVIYHII